MLKLHSPLKPTRKLLSSTPSPPPLFRSTPPPPPPPPPSIPNSPFQQCKTLASTKLLHQQVLVQGLTFSHLNDVVSAYISCNATSQAITLLERFHLSHSPITSWNALIQKTVRFSLFYDTLHFYRKIKRIGCHPDGYTYPFVIKACGEFPSLQFGVSIHCQVYASGFSANLFVCNSLMTMYGRLCFPDLARKVFDEMSERGIFDVVSWNAIIGAYVRNECFGVALKLFERMASEHSYHSIRPNAVSLVNVLPGCGGLGCLPWGKQLHGFAVRSVLFEDVFVGNALVDMYAKCGMTEEASKVFKRMRVRDVVSWNAMVTGYSQAGKFDEALTLFEEMQEENVQCNIITWSAVIAAYAQRERGYEALGVFRKMMNSGLDPNVVTLISLLSGCACVGALLKGKETHGYAIKCILNIDDIEPVDNLMIVNGLIDMYTKCKESGIARTIFDSVKISDRNVVTWTAMIGGYAQNGDANDAIELFSQMMQQSYTSPNAFTMSCVLMACSHSGALRIGEQVHAYILRNHFEPSVMFVANCLIDMYSKSGNVNAARAVFDSMKRRNAVSWTSLMAGYGMHGRGEDSLMVFDRMREAGLTPDSVTFVVVLYSCSHAGMIERGMRYFNDMKKEFGVIPGAEHYACMVDLLGRSGRLEEAKKLIEDMPMKQTPMVWIALLGACRIHSNVKLGEYAASRLSGLESQDDGTYTLLSNIYAGAKQWKDVSDIRSLMRGSGVKKKPGCSWVQEKKGVVSFYVGDWSHPQSEQIYELLSDLIKRIKNLGYVPETSFALHDVDDEEKSDFLLGHSEKMALAYAILTSKSGSTIRITKNLRVCGDCHTVFTYISQIVDHEIVLRDSSRFHHFKNGLCSCKGYW